MSQILEGIEGVLCQTDDFLIFGRTEAALSTVLDKVDQCNVTQKENRKKTSVS
jgi:hypothetical protein